MCIKGGMHKINFKNYLQIFLIYFTFTSISFGKTLNKIEIVGNDRIADETILMFSSISEGQKIEDIDLNKIIKNLYDTNYFKSISTIINDNVLIINVEENKIIGNIFYDGIKAQKIIDVIKDNIKLKRRSSYTKFLLNEDKEIILDTLKEIGLLFFKG